MNSFSKRFRCPSLKIMDVISRLAADTANEQDFRIIRLVSSSSPVSTRKTPRKADSGVAVQYHSMTASACETAVLQLKGSGRRTYLQPTRSVLLMFSVIVPQGRNSGRHSNVAVMQSTDNRNRNQATRSRDGFRLGCGKRWIAV